MARFTANTVSSQPKAKTGWCGQAVDRAAPPAKDASEIEERPYGRCNDHAGQRRTSKPGSELKRSPYRSWPPDDGKTHRTQRRRSGLPKPLRAHGSAARHGITRSLAIFARWSAADRRVINGIFYVLRTGIPWADLPSEYGPPTTVYNRFNRWSYAGHWDRIMDAIADAHSPNMIRNPFLQRQLYDHFVEEVRQLPDAVFFSLGPKVQPVLEHLVRDGAITSDQVASGMLHPSPNNTYRITYLTGDRSGPVPHATNPAPYDAGKEAFRARMLKDVSA